MSSSDEDTRKEVFAWYGGAAYYAQCFEVELQTLIILINHFRNPSMTIVGVENIDAKLSHKNLGGLIRELKRLGVMHQDFEALLHEYRRKRNY